MYYYDQQYDLYIINMNNLKSDLEYHDILKEISIIEKGKGNDSFGTYYSNDGNYCIIDSKMRKINQETIELIVQKQQNKIR